MRDESALELASLTASLASAPRYRNSLQPGPLARVPVLLEVLTALETAGLHGALMSMSGSGATCFALAEDAAHAARAAAELATHYPRWWVRATRTV
jgi:4-diphosphocytidyl-2-C-methyl-D-erythritol kinase